ncbi:MAG TPA: LysR substrate-binding domain-containing protein [Acidisoma sp.]|uniref:LysR substrate-binding domain-containing protein n=1 Tax=Acidisoma sp. TaxID=1872115 RepID=UPI002C108B6A|nr:LysR substrate-binding domain-containing protein [Acidisoma sp.]HTH99432.1 LysR substrate-binding domain-containing protein [Acidisoma sp.]
MAELGLAGLSLRDLEYACTVAELRHFGRAAARCGVSQPALSEQIRKLEGVLRLTLFERSRKGVEITPEGAAILAQAREVLGAARSLLEMAHSQGDPLAGPLRLGVIPTLGPYYLPSVLHALRTTFPELGLRLEEGKTEEIATRLAQGALDLALIALPEPGPGFTAMALFFEPFQLVAPQGHAVASLPRLTVADLRTEDFLLLEEGHCLRDQTVALCGATPDREGRFASSLEMLRHMIAAGEGFSLLPLLSLHDRRELEGLAIIRPVEEISLARQQAAVPGRTIGLLWRARDPRAEAFHRLGLFLRREAPRGTRQIAAI